mgnify:CR=1 FL=1
MAGRSTLEILLEAKDKTGPTLDKVGKSMAVIGVAATAAFAFAAKGAADFEKGMAEVNTLVNLSGDQIDGLSDQVRELSRTFGIDAIDSTKALYQAISAGQKPAEVIGFLEVAARNSVGGVVDLTTSVAGLTNIINAFKFPASETERVSDILFRTVANGITTMNELSSSFFQAAPVAAAAGVRIEELAAAVATVTLAGTPTKIAMTGLRQLMLSMQKPTSEMSNLLRGLGFETGQAALDALRSASWGRSMQSGRPQTATSRRSRRLSGRWRRLLRRSS